MSLSPAQIETFVAEGCVRLDAAVPGDVVAACADELWAASGCDRDDPATWTRPVVRLPGSGTPPFAAAATAPALHAAYDQLVGAGRWVPRSGLGTFPLRFPHPDPPGDDGWHVEASWAGADGGMRLDLRSHERALLMLFLFTDVEPEDAPTRVRLGSHLDVPPFLADAGDAGRAWMDVCRDVVPASAHRPVGLATGRAGDVWLCHPFLVHAAQPHRGTRPRFIAQPPLAPAEPFDLTAADPPPVVRAILAGLPEAAPPRLT